MAGTIGIRTKTLSLDLSGAGDAEISEAGDSKLRSSGAGSVTIHALKGTLTAKLAGAGNLTVDLILSPSVALSAAGRSDIQFGKGSIADFSLESAGASNAVVDAVVSDARVSLSGIGDVTFAKLTGHLNQAVAGMGKVTVVEH